MIIRTAKKQSRYSTVDNTGFNDPRLSYKAKGLLAYFLTKPDDWEIHIDDVRKHGTDGKDSIQAGMRELRDYGYAELSSVRGEAGKVVGRQWIIHEVPASPTAGKSGFRSSPTAGKTVCRENRLTVLPSDGKSGYIVSTDLRASTDSLVNTDYVRTGDEQKNSDLESKKENAPPVPAAPPRLLFSETHYATYPVDFWAAIQQGFPAVPTNADFYYYHQRCLDWSTGKQAKSNDWPKIGAKFILDDQRKGDLHTYQSSHHDSNTNGSSSGKSSQPPLIDRDSIIERASAIASRLRGKQQSRYSG